MKAYIMVYYLPNQSELFSNPYAVKFQSVEELMKGLKIAEDNGYRVIDIIAK